jgi:hypothetical protein
MKVTYIEAQPASIERCITEEHEHDVERGGGERQRGTGKTQRAYDRYLQEGPGGLPVLTSRSWWDRRRTGYNSSVGLARIELAADRRCGAALARKGLSARVQLPSATRTEQCMKSIL